MIIECLKYLSIKNKMRPISLSGGLFYHLKALRVKIKQVIFRRKKNDWILFRQGLEIAFREQNYFPIKNKAENFSTNGPSVFPSRLLLIGPSGGYTLPQMFFKTDAFSEIVCIDPDPIAYFILNKKFKKIKIFWIFDSFLSVSEEDYEKLRMPFSHILFCNVLGQLCLEDTEKHRESSIRQLKNWLSGQSNLAKKFNIQQKIWSYHDRLSGSLLPSGQLLGSWAPYIPLNQDLVQFFYEDKKGELSDHDTENLVNHCLEKDVEKSLGDKKDRQAFYLTWKISSRQIHLIEVLDLTPH